MKRTLAFVLCLMMVLSMLPASVLAEEAPVTEAPAMETPAEETPVEETPAEEETLELLAVTASITMAQTTSNVVVTYTVPDMASAATELQLWKYDSESGRSKRVTRGDCSDPDDWTALPDGSGYTFTWVVDGHSFAEHGEGHYYCTTVDGTVESGKLDFEFAYAQNAAQVEAPANVALNGDSSLLTYTSANPVMAVAWQMNGDEILWQDYVLVSDQGAAVSELLSEEAVAGTCYLAVFAYNRKDYVNNTPSEWVTVQFAYGAEDDTAPLASGTCGDNLQWSLSADYVLTITGTGAMDHYSNAPWADWAEDITAVSLPDGLTQLGGSALYKCTALTEIDLPDSLETIGSKALAACHSLESLHIPAKVTSIGNNALGYTISLRRITVDAANTAFRAENNFLLSADGKTLVACPSGLTGTVTLPDGITAIGPYACCGSKAEAFVLPDSLTAIESGSFAQCNLLESIEIPAGVTRVGNLAFDRCKNLQTVTFKGDAPTLPNNVFDGCPSDFRILYDPATTGWSTPAWNGWPAYPIGSLPAVPTPAYVQWGKRDQGDTLTDAPGWLVFPAQGDSRYRMTLYRVKSGSETEDVEIYTVNTRVSEEDIYCSIAPFARAEFLDDFVTGDYYAVITPLGDKETTADGAPITSPVWHFTRPDLVFEIDSDTLAWGADNALIWQSNVTDSNQQYVERYAVQFYFNPDKDDPDEAEDLPGDLYYPGEEPFTIPEELLEEYGPGWYYYDVNIQTTNPCDALSIGESDMSPALHYTGPASPLSVENPVWGSGMTLSWTDTSDDPTLVDRYWVQFLHNPDEDNAAEAEHVWYFNYYAAEAPHIITENALNQAGEGWYYFRVQACGAMGSGIPDSQWSELSAGYRFTKPAKTLAATDPVLSGAVRLDWRFPDADQSLVKSFEVEFYYSGVFSTDIDDYELIQTPSIDASWRCAELPGSSLSRYGDGWYMAAVQPITNDPLTANTGEWVYSAPFQYTSTLPRAPQATDLQWNTGYNWDNQPHPKTGMIAFKGMVDTSYSDRTEYIVELFRQKAGGDVSLGRINMVIWADRSGSYLCVDPFAFFADDMVSGTYYFTVTTRGTAGHTKESEPIRSADWTYTRPAAQLTVSGSRIHSNLSVDWTLNGNIDYLQNYEVQFGFAPFGQHFREDTVWGTDYWPGGPPLYIPDDFLQEQGSGNYYFRARAVTYDVAQAAPSAWSDWSDPVAYTVPKNAFSVSNPRWDNQRAVWSDDVTANAPLLFYQVRYYYGRTADSINYDSCIWDTTYAPSDVPARMPQQMLQEYGEGYYAFKVKAVSSDPANLGSSQWSKASAPLYVASLPKLPAPTDLQWHIDYNWQWNQTTQQEELVPFTRKGSVSFKRPVDANGGFADQAFFEIEIFRIEADGTHTRVTSSSRGIGSMSTDTHVADGNFIYRDLPSGKYYFKVRCSADQGNYISSDWASSLDYPNGTYEYKQPAPRLSVPTGLYWDDRTYTDGDGNLEINALWTPDSHSDTFYFVEYFFAKTADTPMSDWVRCSGSMNVRAWGGIPRAHLHEESISEYGEGIYYFRVQALPANIEDCRISEWSPFSPGYRLDLTVDKVNDALDNVNTSSAAAIQNAVSNIDHLDKAMAADAEKGTSGTLNKLKALEDKVKAQLNVTTTVISTTADIDVTKVKASNMALNVDTAAAQGATVTLNITTPSDPNVAPPAELIAPQKKNTVIFSMDIDGAKDANSNADGKQLLIPVQITLPVPGDINPAFLVILHQKSDGSWEELRLPHVFRENGQWYATFNVTSFSNYAMGEKNITAQAEGTTVTVDAHLPTSGVNTQYLCAVYSAGHQMLGLGILQPQAENALTITLGQPVPTGAYLKIFAPDAGNGWAVHSDAITVEIQ